MTKFTAHTFATVSILALLVPGGAVALTWNVPGDASNTCNVGNPSCNTITDAVAAASGGDDIQVAADTYNESLIVVDKQLTINGADAATTIVDPAGNVGFFIRADGVVISNLTIRNADDGARIDAASVDNTEFNTVRFVSSTSEGIQIGGAPGSTYTDVRIVNSTFSMNLNGIRMTSTSLVEGLDVSGSTFSANTGLAIYQANDGVGPPSSRLSDLHVSNSRFEDNASGAAAIYAEELRDSIIETSSFEGNQRDVLLFKGYTTSGVDAGNITIRDNTFTNSISYSVGVVVQDQGLGNPVNIEGNVFHQDVGLLATANPRVEIRLASAFTHAPINVIDNQIYLSGILGGATAAHGIAIRGNGPVVITGNVIDGGNVGGAGGGTIPPSSGIYIRSQDSLANFAAIPSGAVFEATCNLIVDFQYGVSIFSVTTSGLGGLDAGAVVAINDNVISGNVLAGVANGATPTVDAEENFWGCAEGPGNAGCDEVIGAVDFEPFATSAPPCVPRETGEECEDPAECISGYCVDGVCCNEACTADGATCAAPSAPGICVDDLGEACVDGSTCILGFCVDGVCCNEACTADDATCVAPAAPGVCVDDLGEACVDGSTCDLGFCVDGVCCNEACTADGATCAAPSAPGICVDDLGEACVDGSTCDLGFCVDGVCCIEPSCPGTCSPGGICIGIVGAPLVGRSSMIFALGLMLAVGAFGLRRRREV